MTGQMRLWLLIFLSPLLHAASLSISTASRDAAKSNIPTESMKDLPASVWERVSTCEPRERDEVLSYVKAPPGLKGTYYVNGFASCKVGNRLVHPFEAYGFVKAITFREDGSVRLQARYVDTPVRQTERRFNRLLFRGSMSAVADMHSLTGNVLNALSPLSRETANLALRPWAGKLLATADNCPYFEVETTNMTTRGKDTFNGVLKGHKMLAHTRVDSKNERLVSCAVKYAAGETTLTFFEFDKDGRVLREQSHQESPAFVVHDWMVTPNYYVVPAAEAVFDSKKMVNLVLGRCTAISVFFLDDKAPGTLLLIPRGGSGKVIKATMKDGHHEVAFHLGPTYEQDGNTLVASVCAFDRYQFGDEMGFLVDEQRFEPTPWSINNGGAKFRRWTVTIDPEAGTGKIASTRLSAIVCDMPTFHPKRDGLKSRYAYLLCGIRPRGYFPFNSLAKFDLEKGTVDVWPSEAKPAAKGRDLNWDGGSSVRSEPLFVPRLDAMTEDDGFVLSTTHDADAGKTYLDIFDAHSFGKGPIQQIELGELWGWNVHSSFNTSKTA